MKSMFNKFQYLMMVLLLGTACSMGEAKKVALSISFDTGPQTSQSMMLFNSTPAVPYISPLPNFTTVTPPSSVSGFECLGLNVMGEGIPSVDLGDNGYQDNNAEQRMPAILSGDACSSYPGAMSAMTTISSGDQTISVNVPSGSTRVVQVVGFKSNIGCPSYTDFGGIIRDLGPKDNFDQSIAGIYELGRTVTDIFKDMTLDITSAYDPTNPKELTHCGNDNGDENGGSFSPSSVTGLVAWYSGDSGVLKTGGIQAVDGEAVDTWYDQSGNANNLAWEAGSPAYETNDTANIPNNKPVILFTGSGAMVKTGFSQLSSLSGITAYVVNKYGADCNVLSAAQSTFAVGEDTFYLQRQSTTVSRIEMDKASTPYVASKTGMDGQYHLNHFTWDGSTIYTSIDGVFSSGTAFAGTMNFSGKLRVGGGATNVNVAEIVIYNRYLNMEETDSVQCYLGNKYGIHVDLLCSQY